MNPVTVSDRPCCDCGGVVTLFGVPDKVWQGLGLTTEYICLHCLAKRLNPDITADAIGDEIGDAIGDEMYRQRRRFKLTKTNRYLGVRMPGYCVYCSVSDEFAEVTAAQVEGR